MTVQISKCVSCLSRCKIIEGVVRDCTKYIPVRYDALTDVEDAMRKNDEKFDKYCENLHKVSNAIEDIKKYERILTEEK